VGCFDYSVDLKFSTMIITSASNTGITKCSADGFTYGSSSSCFLSLERKLFEGTSGISSGLILPYTVAGSSSGLISPSSSELN